MEKKKAIILILGITIVILITFLFFYFRTNTNTNVPVDNTTQTQNGFGDTSVDKTNTNTANFGDTSTPTSTTTNNTANELGLKQIFQEPVAGATIFGVYPNEKVRLVERSNGNIHEISFGSSQITRITNTTIPKIYEALFDKTGTNVLLRYIKDKTEKIATYSAKITLYASTSNEFAGIISGSFLPENIKTIAINKNSSKIFYLLETDSGSAGFTGNIDGTSKKQVFTSELKNWSASWVGDNTVSLLTKPSYYMQGFLFDLNTSDGSLEQVTGDIYGLTTLVGNNGNSVLFSKNVRGRPTLGYMDIEKDIDSSLSLSTFADKCVWSKMSSNIVYCAVPKSMPSGLFPDAWYNGSASFSDDFWEINTADKTTTLLYQTKDNESVDVSDPVISAKDNYIIFINKKDLSLWEFKISPAGN
ncbi:MAG: hypothetical protein WCC74_01385 [Minisyncoccia bacterium]